MHESDRPSMLFLSQCLPYPPDSGVTKRTFNIIKELATDYRISLVAFSRRNHQSDQDALRASAEALSKAVDYVAQPSRIPSETSGFARVFRHLKSLLTGEAYTYYIYDSPVYRQALRNTLSSASFDAVHIDSMDLYRWIECLPDIPATCTHHSIESELMRLRAERTDHVWERWYMCRQADRIEHLEKTLTPSFSRNLMMSHLDAEKLTQLAPQAKTAVVPNGVDTDTFRRTTRERRAGEVVFLGPTYMFPNLDGIRYFLDEIWPNVRHNHSSATFTIIGKCPEELAEEFEAHPGVSSTGYVDDIRPIVSRASCFVVPLRVGGGTRLKILDAWALECPVVSTTLGCEGLQTEEGENILIRDEPIAFAEAVADVLENGDRANQLGEAGRRTVEDQYDWSVIGADLRDIYSHLIE